MIRAKALAIASTLLLLFVTGCNQEEQAEEVAPTPVVVKKKPKLAGASPAKTAASPGKAQAPAAASAPKKQAQAAPKAAPPAKSAAAGNPGVKDTLTKLNGYLPAAVKALQANDVDTAKQYVQGFSDNWEQKIIQNTVKTKSKASYDKIAAGVTQVNNAMKADTPDNGKAIAAIQSLSQAVSEYAKSP